MGEYGKEKDGSVKIRETRRGEGKDKRSEKIGGNVITVVASSLNLHRLH